ncbi:MAG: hypothetical protein QOD86_3043 [Miltoncostaeaceae bacterium]|nr:hypothetical protein [Miltoncostaeaceae bacterium]
MARVAPGPQGEAPRAFGPPPRRDWLHKEAAAAPRSSRMSPDRVDVERERTLGLLGREGARRRVVEEPRVIRPAPVPALVAVVRGAAASSSPSLPHAASAASPAAPAAASACARVILGSTPPFYPSSRRSAALAARYPHIPCTPPPGGVEDEHR